MATADRDTCSDVLSGSTNTEMAAVCAGAVMANATEAEAITRLR